MPGGWSWRAIGLGLGLIVMLAGAVWLWRAPLQSKRAPDLRGANVLLVTIDTLRADRVGAYGSTAGLTPTLDELAGRGIRFTHVWSHAPMTLPSHASILTGIFPTRHGVRNNGAFRLGAEPTTLAERLRAAGYRTAAFVGAFVLDARFGLNRGFDEYDDRYEAAAGASFHFVERPADRVLQAATAWIDTPAAGTARPWFAWVHLFDPHAPYKAPPAFARERAAYDAEVAWTDSALGAALNELTTRGRLERTIVVVTSDHGEALGDHGETTHGLFAYDATLRVPLIIAAPGVEARVVSTPTGLVDIAPTILDLVGVAPPSPLDGRSRRAALLGESPGAVSPIYFEALDANLTRGWAPLTGLTLGKWKYIDLPEPELYDLDADPGERANLVAREPHSVEELQARLRSLSAPVPPSRTVDAATASRLQSLGYVTGAAKPRTTFTMADDPKRLVALSERFNTALEDFSSGRAEDALQKLLETLGSRADFLAARLSAATVLLSMNRAKDAVRLLEDAPADDKGTPQWLTRTGQALAAAGDLRKAQEVLNLAVAEAQGDIEALNELGIVLLRSKEHEAARRAFEQLLEIDPTAVGTLYNLGLLEMSVRRPSAAAVRFRRVVDLDPRHVDGWRGLGAALVADDPARAIEAWKRAVELAPEDFDTLYNLGMLLNEEGRHAEALPHLERFVAEAPSDHYKNDFPRVRAILARAKSRR